MQSEMQSGPQIECVFEAFSFLDSKFAVCASLFAMSAVTVRTNEGGSVHEEVYEFDLAVATVGAMRQEIKARTQLSHFCLRLKLPKGDRLLSLDEGDKSLAEAGLFEGCLIQVKNNKSKEEWRKWRLDARVAKQLHLAKTANEKLDAVDGKADDVLNVMRGGPPKQREGQSDCARLKEIRHIKGFLTSEAESLRDREERRKSDERLHRSESAIAAAEQADGNAELATASLDGATLEEKAALLKAQSKIVAIALRKQKAEERKATAAPKVAAKRRRTAKAVAAQDPDQSIEKEL